MKGPRRGSIEILFSARLGLLLPCSAASSLPFHLLPHRPKACSISSSAAARAVLRPSSSYADPHQDGRVSRSRYGGGSYVSSGPYVGGGGTAYCVRLCDGRYFPISNRTGNAAEICKSFCPASPTKVFSGSAIDQAYSPDGKRYSDIPNAFVYRAKLVTDCTCDGKSPTGLVRLDVNNDETLATGRLRCDQQRPDGLSGREPQHRPVYADQCVELFLRRCASNC